MIANIEIEKHNGENILIMDSRGAKEMAFALNYLAEEAEDHGGMSEKVHILDSVGKNLIEKIIVKKQTARK